MDDPSSAARGIRDVAGQAVRHDPDAGRAATLASHLFDQAIALDSVADQNHNAAYEGRVHPGFKNFNDPYGGWSAAILAQAILKSCDPALELVALTVDYLCVASDGSVKIDVDCDRLGRGTEFWRAVLTAGADRTPANRATGILARRRDTIEWTESDCPEAPLPEGCPTIDLPLAWTSVIEIRPAVYSAASANSDTHSSAWVRFAPDRPLDSVALVALADTPMPRLFHIIGREDPVATISMTVYLHASAEDYAAVGTDYVLVDARGGKGFYDQHATIWSRDGRLLVTTQQMVWYRATR